MEQKMSFDGANLVTGNDQGAQKIKLKIDKLKF